MREWLSNGGWLVPFGIGCLALSWWIKTSEHRKRKARNLRIWAMLPDDVKDVYLANGTKPENYRRPE